MTTTKKRNQGPGWADILRELQRGVMIGSIHPRQRLVEEEILEQIPGSTRHAVRRALDELEKTGLAVRQQNKGVQVRDFTISEIRELYEIRTCLETWACARFQTPAEPATVEHLTDIAARHREASRANRLVETFTLNDQFHHAVYEAAGNSTMATAIRQYAVTTQPMRTRGISTELKEVAISEHFQMIDMIRDGKGQALAEIVRGHLERPLEIYIRAITPA